MGYSPQPWRGKRRVRLLNGSTTSVKAYAVGLHPIARWAIRRHDAVDGCTHSLKLEIKGDWTITKDKLKRKRAKLTDDDLPAADLD